jgi:hypothetical protein
MLAAAFALGLDIRRLLFLACVVYLPIVAGAVVVLVVWRARPREDTRAALFCEGVAAELRAGSVLRDALATAVTAVGGAEIPAWLPVAGLAEQVAAEFPDIEAELRLTVINAARTGSDTAALFDEIGSLALAQSEIRREVHVATAPGRATAFVLVGAPLFYIAGQAGSGGVSRMLASSQQRVVALLGLAVFTVGLVAAVAVVTRAGR